MEPNKINDKLMGLKSNKSNKRNVIHAALFHNGIIEMFDTKLILLFLHRQEAQLPLRNRASATYFFVAKLISIAHSCL